jgi:hypothetical protein
MVEFVLLQMLLMCGPHFRSDVIVHTSSVSDMLDQLKWPSLESQRTNSQITMMYKMTKNQANIDTSDKLIPLQRPSRKSFLGVVYPVVDVDPILH